MWISFLPLLKELPNDPHLEFGDHVLDFVWISFLPLLKELPSDPHFWLGDHVLDFVSALYSSSTSRPQPTGQGVVGHLSRGWLL